MILSKRSVADETYALRDLRRKNIKYARALASFIELNLAGSSITYAVLNDFHAWVCILAMLLGRLEMFTLLVVWMRAF